MQPPNVLLLVMDTARASSVLPTESPGVMPTIEQLTHEGTIYKNAITTAPWTLPSHASLFSGQYTTDHGTHAGSKTFDPKIDTIFEKLQKSGYQTVAISNNSWISPEFGFGRGFEDFYLNIEPIPGGAELADIARYNKMGKQIHGVLNKLSISNALPTLINAAYARFIYKRYDDGAMVANWRIKHWLKKKWDQDAPFCMFVNYLEPHLKYDPPRSFRYDHLSEDISKDDIESANQDAWKYVCGSVEMTEHEFDALEALYKGELSYLDYRIREIYKFLDARGILDDTVLIITGDHGENIGDHNLMDHQYSLYDTLLRVPLIVRYPDIVPTNQSVSSLIELRDLYPTLINITNIDSSLPSSVSEYTLPKIGIKNDPEQRDYTISEYLVPQPSLESLSEQSDVDKKELKQFDKALRCIRTNKYKFIEGTGNHEELYNIRTDPVESNNLIDIHPEIANDLRDKLHTKFGRIKKGIPNERGQMQESTQQQLEDLGYI